jgi:molybdenum cofactor guanylyltransferase
MNRSALTAFVLAGGLSRRMGRPKHALVLGGETLLERALRLARPVARRVAVVGPPERVYELGLGAPVFADEIAARGPLGGIYTGLCHTRTEFNLFLSCDLPFMETRFLRYLAGRARECGRDVTLAETPGQGYQPLAAIYRRRALAAVRASLASGENKVSRFFSRVRLRVLTWPEIARAGFGPSIFDNLNTEEDYARAVRKTWGLS